MSARIAPLAVILGLVVCPAALGKGLPQELEVCGADGCVDRTARVAHPTMLALMRGGPAAGKLRREQPYYVLRIGFGRGEQIFHRVTKRWFPEAGLVHDVEWTTATDGARRALRRLTWGIEPVAAGSPPPVPVPDAVTGQLPPEVMAPVADHATGDDGGPSAALIAAPAAALLGLAALAGRRRRRG